MVQATKSHVQPLVTRTKFELDHATNGLLNTEFEQEDYDKLGKNRVYELPIPHESIGTNFDWMM